MPRVLRQLEVRGGQRGKRTQRRGPNAATTAQNVMSPTEATGGAAFVNVKGGWYCSGGCSKQLQCIWKIYQNTVRIDINA